MSELTQTERDTLEAIKGVLFRHYEREYDASHLCNDDFHDNGVEILNVARAHLSRPVVEDVLNELNTLGVSMIKKQDVYKRLSGDKDALKKYEGDVPTLPGDEKIREALKLAERYKNEMLESEVSCLPSEGKHPTYLRITTTIMNGLSVRWILPLLR